MSGGIADEPLAQSVLRHLAEGRDKGDPVGSLARTVLGGDATLQQAIRDPWHGNGLAEAAAQGLEKLKAMSKEERAAFDQDVKRLRDPYTEPAASPRRR